jgi:hypothetical protein
MNKKQPFYYSVIVLTLIASLNYSRGNDSKAAGIIFLGVSVG